MNDTLKLAQKSLDEIRATEEKMQVLSEKKKWIENVKKDPQKAAFLYFDIFNRLAKYPITEGANWEEMALLLHFGINPISVKNEDGLNPLEYFYKRNREERLSLHDLPTKHRHLGNQNEVRFETIANRLYNTLQDFGLTEKQLTPIQKVRNLWHNYRRLLHKQADTGRVAFARLLKTVIKHPEDAVSADDFQQVVHERLEQEYKEERQAVQSWVQWSKKDYRAQYYRPKPGHYRGYSPFDRGLYGMFDGWKKYLLYQPLPESSKKALDDFLLSLKDVDAYTKPRHILPKKRLAAYRRALNPPKRFEKTR